ncbi:hypothetical protein VTL71DRAFT_6944 [Oculimacula yallundae]|uniref:Uncharacterized protein n=1 Tax=Oculimacula yallundae TaxID=86028 RepID=A0ABR4BV96_9HELO
MVGAQKCVECVALNEHRARHLSTLHCKNHGCPALDGHGQICGKKKSKGEYGCINHPPPPPPPRACEAISCNLLPSKPSTYCNLHKCVFSGCLQFSNAALNQDYCADHKCSVQRCQALRKRIRVGNHLELAFFCVPHECETNGCTAQKVSRGHCGAHCCTFPNCPAARRTDLGTSTYCLGHFSEELRNQAAAAARRDTERQFQAQIEKAEVEALKKARIMAEQKEKQKEEEEAILHNQKVKFAEDEERRKKHERERSEKTYHDRQRGRNEASHESSRQQEAPSKNYDPHFYEKPNDFRTTDNSYGKYTQGHSRDKDPAFSRTGGGHYTSIPNRSVPRGGYQKGGDRNSRNMDADQSRHRREDRAKRNSDGSFVNVEVHQDDDHDWASDSATNDSDYDHHEHRQIPRSGPAYQRERGYSNEASAGSNVGDGIRDDGPRYKHREDKYQGEVRTRVRRKDREAAYADERERQAKYTHERDDDRRGGKESDRSYGNKENVRRTGW